MNTITKGAILVMAGTALTNSAYVPQQKHRPSAEIIAEYLQSNYYCPMSNNRDWKRSEERKALLNRLNDVRKEIRTSAAEFRKVKSLEANHDQATNLVTGALNSMMLKANKNIAKSTAKYKDEIAACPAHLRGEFIKLLLRNKAILIIDTFDDIVTV